MDRLGLQNDNFVDDSDLLKKMKELIFHDGDIRPVWIGGGYANTTIAEHVPYARWANEHWALYYSFINDIDKTPKLILDLGCGSGFCTRNIKSLYETSKVIGIDIHKESIDFCKNYNTTDGVEYLESNLILDTIPKNVDYIFFVETLEHIKHEYHYLLIDKLLECLNPDGKLFISTPNESYYSEAEKGHIGILTPEHFTLFKERYKNNILSVRYIDNSTLLSGDYVTDNDSDSHFKIIMKK